MKKYTGFDNVDVKGELKTGTLKAGTLEANTMKLDLSGITRPTAAGDSYSKAQIKSIVDALDAVLTLLGKPTT